ncbi:MAG: hypothetical protein R6V49_02850, partial [Bacteroidales bacterium]
MRITAFKIPKPKRFEYTPRYYDPQRELREERERRVLRELENESSQDPSSYRPMGKADAKHYISFGRPSNARERSGGFMIRLITIILAL